MGLQKHITLKLWVIGNREFLQLTYLYSWREYRSSCFGFNFWCFGKWNYLVINVTIQSAFFFFFFFFFCLLRATSEAYGGSQARGPIRDLTPSLNNSHSNADPSWAVTCTIAYSNARSLTHWARPGIELESSWMLVRFINHWATRGTLQSAFDTNCPIQGDKING